MLVIMKDGNVHPLFQGLFNDKAIGCGDIFEVNAAKSGLEQLDRVNETLRVFSLYFNIDRIDISEAFEKDRLAFHDGFGSKCAQIAHAQNSGAVRYYGHKIALCGVVVSSCGIIVDRLHWHRDARRVSKRKITLSRHWLGCHDLNLPGTPLRMEIQRFLRSKLDVTVVHYWP